MTSETDKLKILLALIFILAGMSISVLSHPIVGHGNPVFRFVGILIIIFGILYIYFKYKFKDIKKTGQEYEPGLRKDRSKEPKLKDLPKKDKITIQKLRSNRRLENRKTTIEPETQTQDEGILTRFMRWVFKRSEGISLYTLPIAGAIIIDAVLIYNILYNQSLDLQGFDSITIAFGASLILYNYIPSDYNFGKDFLVFFLGLLFFILIFPPVFYNAIIGPGGNAVITKTLLGDPVSWLLNVGGIESTSEIVNGSNGEFATIYFPLAQNDLEASVQIGESCSGIYTVSIFLSAFITFVLLEYKKFNYKVGLLIGLGIFVSYIGNIIRMLIIVLVGHYYDTDPGNLVNLGWTHSYAGIFIFLAWIVPFWVIMYWYLMRKDIKKKNEEKN